MKIFKAIMSVILTSLIAFLILGIAILGSVKNTIFSREYALKIIEESNGYENIKIVVDNNIKQYTENSNIETSILEEFATTENIENLVEQFLSHLYENSEFVLNEQSIKFLINDNINEIIKKENIKLTDEEKLKVNEIINDLSYTIDSQDMIENNKLYNPIPDINEIINIIYNALIVVTIVMLVLIILINLSNILDGIKFLASSVLISGIFLVVCQKIVEDFNFNQISTNVNTIKLVKGIISDVANKIANTGKMYIIVSGITICACIIIPIIRKNIFSKPNSSL